MSEELDLIPHIERLAYAVGDAPKATAQLKTKPEDFVVEEILGFSPSGEGEHIYIHVKAIDYNTEYLLSHIARSLGVPKKSVVYSGLKDRYAVASQWFSVHLPGNEQVDLTPINNDNVTVLESARNLKKLRRGAHKANRFTIRLRSVDGDKESINARLESIQKQGFPNYFGPQRFGRNENNITDALASVASGRSPKKRFQRSIEFSTLRSLLFNLSLSERIKEGAWKDALPGDVFALSGTESFFVPKGAENGENEASEKDSIDSRLASGDIAVAGVLYGDGTLPQTDVAAEKLLEVFRPYASIMEFLTSQRVAISVRPFSVLPKEFSYVWEDVDTLILSFSLPKGVFATSLLRECINC
ncbi:MAG: tRNA pseudouridine(13) synthase TruD [Moraxellaceae bacterium]|nr:MAG: tRNA pseudouridine(13) synthase TruD [Moraxellaceae bacterium]